MSDAEPKRLDALGYLLTLMGVGALANSAWMLIGAAGWFQFFATDTGALNEHLVRDVGAAYAAAGAALVWAGAKPALRSPLTVTAALFFGLHALGHIYDTARGALGSDHWLEDLPGVYLPAVLLVWLALRARR